tara:strand:- start:36 stop:629 length:594 start_codon:yes stop_codon:yes gene_type:complete
MSRFDNRDIDTFKKDIYFGTQMEKYFFNKWLDICQSLDYINVANPRNNGVDNSGEFIAKGNTAGADYMIDLCYHALDIPNMPLEIKWVPTFGKLTLKTADLEAYIKEKAGILFIYPSQKTINLKKPRDYNLTNHIEKIESVSEILRWSLMSPAQVRYFLEEAKDSDRIQPIPYMGNKSGIILKEKYFTNWFTVEQWT